MAYPHIVPRAGQVVGWKRSHDAAQDLGTHTNPPLLTAVPYTSALVRDLPSCTTHYWRIVAMNDTDSISTPEWHFKTRCPPGQH